MSQVKLKKGHDKEYYREIDLALINNFEGTNHLPANKVI